MNIQRFCLAWCITTIFAGSPFAADYFPYETHVDTLANGLMVIVAPMESGAGGELDDSSDGGAG